MILEGIYRRDSECGKKQIYAYYNNGSKNLLASLIEMNISLGSPACLCSAPPPKNSR